MIIAVLMGGISPERNVSLAGGRSVYDALIELGHTVKAIDPAFGTACLINMDNHEIPQLPPTLEELSQWQTRNIIDAINSSHFDDVQLAFIVLHGQYGEDGKVQALLDLRKIPYTGSKIKASAIGIDKLTSKLLFSAAGIPTPLWVTIRENHFDDFDFCKEIRSELGNKIVIKPNDQGSTIGITIIEDGNLDDIHNAIKIASQYSNIVLAEAFIKGREITVGIVGEDPLPVIEIIPEQGFYDYEHKYKKGMTHYICPAEIDDAMTEFIQETARTAYRIIGCEGFGRVDFRMDEDGQIYCLEVNTIPGFTSTSLVPMAAKETGIEFPDLCQHLIDLALNIEEEE